eukprot:gene3051-3601_t
MATAFEPDTEGKVVLHTSYGEVAVELWAKQTPMACRNFVQLCLEGYYDDTIFHRLIHGFMIQGGDPTGTGEGGGSIYDGPFKDEIHSRLKYTRRGLVGMPCTQAGSKGTNGSQFFVTLDQCTFINGKHTIFGTCERLPHGRSPGCLALQISGTTIFNFLQMAELPVDKDTQRPLNPPRITSVSVCLCAAHTNLLS